MPGIPSKDASFIRGTPRNYALTKEDVMLPDFLQYWPRLKKVADIRKYVSASNDVDQEYQKFRPIYEEATFQQSKVERFYDVLKKRL